MRREAEAPPTGDTSALPEPPLGLLHRLNGWLATALGGLFLVILVLVNAQILFRFALEISVPWTEDVSRLLFVYLIYLGASVAFHQRAMITIDSVPSFLPRTERPLRMIASFLVFLVTAFLFYASIPMVRSSWNTSLPTVDWISNGWAYIAFTISFGLMLLHSLTEFVALLAGRRV